MIARQVDRYSIWKNILELLFFFQSPFSPDIEIIFNRNDFYLHYYELIPKFPPPRSSLKKGLIHLVSPMFSAWAVDQVEDDIVFDSSKHE